MQIQRLFMQISKKYPRIWDRLYRVLTGKTDYKDSLNTLAENTQKEWDNGIAKAKEAGANVSAADFEFKNWNPLEDYTAENYESK